MFTLGRGPGFEFRVGRTPVRIEWSFLAVIAAFGWLVGRDGWSILTWLGVVVIGVLVHEGGHVWALSAFGRGSRVRLSWFSGMTIADDDRPISRGPSIIISLAGPAAGIALGLVANGVLARYSEGVLGDLRRQSIFVNLIWSAFNLLPVMPLDGGHVARELFEWCGERRAATIAVLVVLAAELTVAVILVVRNAEGGWWVLVVTLLFATNIAFLPLTRKARQRQDIRAAHTQLMDGHLAPGIARIQAHLMSPRATLVESDVRTSLAWGLLHLGRMDDLGRLDLAAVDAGHHALLSAAVAWYRGDVANATNLVAEALATDAVPPPAVFFQRTFGRLGEIDQLAATIDRLPADLVGPAHQRLHAGLVAAGRAPSMVR